MTRDAIRGPFAPIILGIGAKCEECGQGRDRRKPTREGAKPDWPHCETCWAPLPGIELVLVGVQEKRWVVKGSLADTSSKIQDLDWMEE